MINENLQGAKLYLDGEALNTYAQEAGIEKVAEALGVDVDTIKNAAENGDTVDVNIGNFEAMAAMPEHANFFEEIKDYVSFEDGGFSYAKEKRAKEFADMLNEAEEYVRTAEENVKIELDRLRDELVAAGRPKQEAELEVKLWAAMAKMHSDPVAFLKKAKFVRGEEGTQGAYAQASMFDVQEAGVENAVGFKAKLQELKEKGKQFSKVKWTDTESGIIYPGDQTAHSINKHSLSDEDMVNIQDGLRGATLEDVHLSTQEKGRFHGKVAIAKMRAGDKTYYTALEFAPNGDIYFLTATPDNEARIDQYIKEHGAERISPKGASSDSRHALSVDMIQQKLGIVNRNNLLSQEAFTQAEEVRKQYTNADGTMKEGWHKAPNGKESNLTEEQWCIVRTPAFKEWFGDWEAANYYNFVEKSLEEKDFGGSIDVPITEKAKERISKEIGVEFGRYIIASADIRHMMKNHGDIATEEADNQIAITADTIKIIPWVLENYDTVTLSKNGKRRKSYLFRKKIDGHIVLCEVFMSPKSISSKTLRIEKDTSSHDAISPAGTSETAGSAYYHSKLKKIMLSSASKVVDENGEPLVVYHGTHRAEFDTFKKGFFTNDKTVADWYAGTSETVKPKSKYLDTKIFNKPISDVLNFMREEMGQEYSEASPEQIVNYLHEMLSNDEFDIHGLALMAEKIKAVNVENLSDVKKELYDLAKRDLELATKIKEGTATFEDVKELFNNEKEKKYEIASKEGSRLKNLNFIRRELGDWGKALGSLSNDTAKSLTLFVGKSDKHLRNEEELRDMTRSFVSNNSDNGVYPVFLNMRNPLVVDAEGSYWQHVAHKNENGNVIVEGTTNKIAKYAQENGYDGTVIKRVNDMSLNDYHTADDYVPVTPNQIKSATANNGNFDANDPNIYHQLAGEQGAANIDLSDKQAIKDFADSLTYNKIPQHEVDEKTVNSLMNCSKQDLFKWALQKVNELLGKKLIDPMGNKIYFSPGNDETIESYSLHLIAGMGKPIENIHLRRAIALEMADKTIQDPFAIVIQPYRDEDNNIDHSKPGRSVYLSLYKTDFTHAGNIIVGVEEGQNGRVITSFATTGDKRHKKAALRNIQNVLKTAYSVEYIRLGTSGYSRPATGLDASTTNTRLHIAGKNNISDNSKKSNTPSEGNKKKLGSYDYTTNVITLFKGANASTVIHESWHFFIEEMYRSIESGIADEQTIKDFETLLEFGGMAKFYP